MFLLLNLLRYNHQLNAFDLTSPPASGTNLQANRLHGRGALGQERLYDAERGRVVGRQVQPLEPRTSTTATAVACRSRSRLLDTASRHSRHQQAHLQSEGPGGAKGQAQSDVSTTVKQDIPTQADKSGRTVLNYGVGEGLVKGG